MCSFRRWRRPWFVQANQDARVWGGTIESPARASSFDPARPNLNRVLLWNLRAAAGTSGTSDVALPHISGAPPWLGEVLPRAALAAIDVVELLKPDMHATASHSTDTTAAADASTRRRADGNFVVGDATSHTPASSTPQLSTAVSDMMTLQACW